MHTNRIQKSSNSNILGGRYFFFLKPGTRQQYFDRGA